MAQHTVPHTGPAGRTTYRTERTPLQWASLVFGIAFLAVGVAGFIPGITTDYDTMELAGHESEAKLLGVFQVSVLHNLAHLLLGVLGVWAARRWTWSRTFLVAGGIAYLALFVYGLVVDEDDDANFVPLNDADDWLHLVLAASMIILGLALRPHRDTRVDFDTTR